MPTATSVDPCACCCPGGFACFQTWTAIWDCDLMAWSGPAAGAKVCLAVGTSTAWAKTASTDTNCTYTKYVRMPICCTVDGDCAEGDDTATPSLPANHDDCTCPEVFPCGSCDITPRTWTISFSGVGNALVKCAGECATGGQKGGTGTLGTYVLTQDPLSPCCWRYHGSGPTILIYPDGTGTCDGEPVELSIIDVAICVGGGSWGVGARYSDETFGIIRIFEGVNDFDHDDPSCCAAKSFPSNDVTYACDNVGDGGTATATPHC